MNKRERTLAIVTGVTGGLFLAFLMIYSLIIKPLRGMDDEAAKLASEINLLKKENRQRGPLEARLREITTLCYGTDELKAGEELRSRLVTLLDQAGMSTEKRLLQPVTGHAMSGTYKEIGRRIQVSGKLNNVVDFLYLLNADQHLHRLDAMSITPAPGGMAEVQLTYNTLVPNESLVGPQASSGPASQPAPDLNQGERALYNAIAARDLFRPYIQRVEPPPPPPPPPVARSETREPSPPPPPPPPPPKSENVEGRYRLVMMPMAPGEPLSVLDQATRQTYSYQIGQFLAGGKIVMVDYRPMPLPDDPEKISPSRMILQIGQSYFAVEFGQSLSARRQLSKDDLPEALRQGPAPAAASRPATAPAAIEAAAAG